MIFRPSETDACIVIGLIVDCSSSIVAVSVYDGGFLVIKRGMAVYASEDAIMSIEDTLA